MEEGKKSQGLDVLGNAMKCLQPAPQAKEPTLGDIFKRMDVIVDQLNRMIELISLGGRND